MYIYIYIDFDLAKNIRQKSESLYTYNIRMCVYIVYIKS